MVTPLIERRSSMLGLNHLGVLPPGIHAMTLDEIREVFVERQSGRARRALFAHLMDLVGRSRAAGFVRFLIVNGSFVTSKAEPGDIDLVVVVDAQVFQRSEWRPDEYGILSSRRLRKAYPFDVFVVPEGSGALAEYQDMFQRVKGSAVDKKGIVRLDL